MTKNREFIGVDDEGMPIEPFEFDRASQEIECEPNGDAESKEETPAEPAEISTGEIAAEESAEALTVPEHVTGRRVSITSPEFEPVIYKIDDIIVRALRTAVDARQGFTVTAKIQFTPTGARFSVSHNVGYKFDPIKVEEKGGLYEDLLVELDEDGNPIIPDGSAQQVTLDDVSGATVTADASGIVQSVELDNDDFGRVFPCECTECPLHTGYTGGDEGCSFCGDAGTPLDSDTKGYIYDAVTVHRCTRGCITEICARELPTDRPEAEPYPCEETDCYLCDFGEVCDLHEDGTSLVPYEDKHIISAVEDFRCTRRFVRKRYGEIIEEGRSHDKDA